MMRRREVLTASFALLGATVSASVARALLSDEPLVSSDAYGVFGGAQRTTVELLSDLIIPPTDTAGAVDAGVPGFVATIFRDWYTDAERASFLQGLVALDDDCREREGKAFNDASAAARVAALQAQEAIAGRAPLPPPGPFGGAPVGPDAPFFTRLKELVVLGYYTSKPGVTQELVYLPAPGRFDGSYDYAKVNRQFSR